MKPTPSKATAAALALCLASPAMGAPDGGTQPPAAVVLAARLFLPDAGMVDVEGGYYLSTIQGDGMGRELAYLRGEKEKLEEQARGTVPSSWVLPCLIFGLVGGGVAGFALSRALSH